MARPLRLIILWLVLTLAIGLFCWWEMTDAQRREVLAWIGSAITLDAAPPPQVLTLPGDAEAPPQRSYATTAYGLPARLCRDWSRPTTAVEKAPIYRWTDPDGRVQFGDRPPAGVTAQDMNALLGASEQFARTSFVDRGVRLGPQLSSVFPTDAAAVGRILRLELGLAVRQIDVRLTLEPPGQALSGEGLSGRHAVGLYTHGRREIAVQEQSTLARTRAIARHETSHAMLAALYGPTPPWINEGLAEVAESLELAGQMRSPQVNHGHAQVLRSAARGLGAGSLETLLTMDARTWKDLPTAQTYAPAWALVHLLMETGAGRRVLKAVLTAQAAAPCQVIDSGRIIDRDWPGGTRALERAWLSRMRSSSWQALHF
ncbi:MAG TPA: DUF4124 domain-containing protein [Pseudomonadales bacterium]|nr:DUF4124 domain-containing protein [Pseudomonadales bacterium]